MRLPARNPSPRPDSIHSRSTSSGSSRYTGTAGSPADSGRSTPATSAPPTPKGGSHSPALDNQALVNRLHELLELKPGSSTPPSMQYSTLHTGPLPDRVPRRRKDLAEPQKGGFIPAEKGNPDSLPLNLPKGGYKPAAPERPAPQLHGFVPVEKGNKDSLPLNLPLSDTAPRRPPSAPQDHGLIPWRTHDPSKSAMKHEAPAKESFASTFSRFRERTLQKFSDYWARNF